jgi:hypothetical protein
MERKWTPIPLGRSPSPHHNRFVCFVYWADPSSSGGGGGHCCLEALASVSLLAGRLLPCPFSVAKVLAGALGLLLVRPLHLDGIDGGGRSPDILQRLHERRCLALDGVDCGTLQSIAQWPWRSRGSDSSRRSRAAASAFAGVASWSQEALLGVVDGVGRPWPWMDGRIPFILGWNTPPSLRG